MTLAEANSLLDAARSGEDVPGAWITAALRATGDLPAVPPTVAAELEDADPAQIRLWQGRAA